MQTLIERISNRTAGRSGIGSARAYESILDGCLKGGIRPTEAFGVAELAEVQQKLAQRDAWLTYEDDSLAVLQKASKATGVELSKNSILDFECVITSKRQDRDGDILDTAGAKPDKSMCFLFNHDPALPIGKLLSITSHTKTLLTGKFAIYDVFNGLGKDVAFLIENDALRISHGFVPDAGEYEPLSEKDGGGWLIKQFTIMETSGVSVPCNVDAVIMAYSRGKLFNPAVKGWAKSLHDQRPVIVPGYSVTREAAGRKETITVTTHAELKEHLASKVKDMIQNKAAGTKSFCVELDGSWGDIQCQLSETLVGYLMANGVRVDSDQTAYICEMFDDRAVVCILDYYSGQWALWQIGWTRTGGKPAWTGTPAAVDISATLQERMATLVVKSAGRFTLKSKLSLKVGRALSAKTEESLRDALALVNEVAKRDDVAKPAKAQLKEAIGLLNDVLSQVEAAEGDSDDNSGDGKEGDDEKRLANTLEKALGSVLNCRPEHLDKCTRFVDAAIGALGSKQAEVTEEENARMWQSILSGFVSDN